MGLFTGVLPDVVVGLIGAGIVAILTIAGTRFRDALIARRYPIAGTFRSTFEDSESGENVVIKAVATLKQRGRRIWGPTTLVSGDRTWILDGRIDDGGRIHGRYAADDPHDGGLGGFFLELHSDGHLEGMWTGYDTANRLVSSGRYMFWPMERLATRQMASQDLDHTLSVLGNALGARYVSRDELAEYVSGEGKFGIVATTKAGQIVGAATADLPTDSLGLMALQPQDARQRLSDLLPELDFNRPGLLRSVAVSPKVRGNGVGTSLVAAAVSSLWARGATIILSIGWTDADGCHIQGPLEAAGFESHGDLADFWTADSIAKDYQCPSCGQPCRCTARVFVKSKA